MAKELSPETKKIITATVPALKAHGVAIVTSFYRILFERYPAVKKYFNMDRQAKGKSKDTPAQIAALARAVLAYAANIEDLTPLLPTVTAICHKHVSRGVLGAHYDAVGECLIAAIGEVLGDAATPPIVNAWIEAYGFLAQIFITTEKDVRAAVAEAAGYDGFADMSVTKIVAGPSSNKVIYVVPGTGKVPTAKKGQYCAIALKGVPNGINETMITANIDESSTSELRLTIPSNGEAGNTHLLSTASVGSILSVGMPCGV